MFWRYVLFAIGCENDVKKPWNLLMDNYFKTKCFEWKFGTFLVVQVLFDTDYLGNEINKTAWNITSFNQLIDDLNTIPERK
jgi:hypothetical protein